MGILLDVKMDTRDAVSSAASGEKAIAKFDKHLSALQAKAAKGVKIDGLESANEQLALAVKTAKQTATELAFLQNAAPAALKAADVVIDNVVPYVFDSIRDKRETRSVPELYVPDIRGSSAEKILADEEFKKFEKDLASMNTHDMLIRRREEILRIEEIQSKLNKEMDDSWFEKNQYSWAYRNALDNLNKNPDDLKEEDIQAFDRNLEEVFKVYEASFNTEETNRHQDLRSLGIQLKDAQTKKAYIEKEQLKRNQREPAYKQGNKGAFEKEPLKQEEPREQKTYEAPNNWDYLAQIEPGAGTVAALETSAQAYLDKDVPDQVAAQWADMPIEEATQGALQAHDNVLQSGETLVQASAQQTDTMLQSGETLAQGTAQQAEQASAAVLGTVEQTSSDMLGNQQNFAQQYDAQAGNLMTGSLQDAKDWQNELAGQIQSGGAERLGLTEEYIVEQRSIMKQAWDERLQTEEDNQDRLAELQAGGGDGLAGGSGLDGGSGLSGGELVQQGIGQARSNLSAGEGSFGDFTTASMGNVVEDYRNMAFGLSEVWGGFFSDFTTGFSNSIGQAIWESESLGDSLYNVATGALSSLTSGLINLGIQWAITKVLSDAVLGDTETSTEETLTKITMQTGASIGAITAITTASSIAAGITTAAWTPAATAVSLGSFGANSAAAIAGIEATAVAAKTAITSTGFAQGGYTGNVGRRKVAGVVHGQEFVFDAEAVDRIGLGPLEALRSGSDLYSGGGLHSGAGLYGNYAAYDGFGYASDNDRGSNREIVEALIATTVPDLRGIPAPLTTEEGALVSLIGRSALCDASGYGIGGGSYSSGLGGGSSARYGAEALEAEMREYEREWSRSMQQSLDMQSQAQAGATLNVSIENYGSNKEFEVKRLSPDDVRIIARDVMRRETPRFVAQEIANPNSDISKGFAYSTNIRRRR